MDHPDPRELAARLLQYAPSTAAVDALALHACDGDRSRVSAYLAPSAARHAPTRDLALRMLQDPALRDLVTNAPVTDPDVLAAMASMRYTHARRAAARNRNTPPAALDELAAAALASDDAHLLTELCATREPLEWLAAVGPGHRIWTDGPEAARLLVENLEQRLDHDLTREVFRVALQHRHLVAVTGALVIAAAGERLGTLAPSDLLGVCDNAADAEDALAEAIVTFPRGVAFGDDLATAIVDGYGHGLLSAGDGAAVLAQARPMTQATVDTLLSPATIGLAPQGVLASHAADLAPLSDHNIAQLLEHHLNPRVAASLFRNDALLARLTPAQVEVVAPHLRDDGLAERALSGPAGKLTAAAAAAILRSGRRRLTGSWISGQFGTGPTVEVAQLLVADWGECLDGQITFRGQLNSLDDLVLALRDWLDATALTRPGVAELLDHAPVAVLQLASSPDGSDAYLRHLTERAEARFGDNPRMWAQFPEVAAAVPTETVTDLLEVVVALVETGPAA